jgi:hypothetical protein
MNCATFCRRIYNDLLKIVMLHTTVEQRKSSWTWKSGRSAQFWVDGEMIWEGRACCKYAARYSGWEKWLRDNLDPETFERESSRLAEISERDN